MRIVFIRHGESEGNVRHEINDDPARIVNLTEKGRGQAATASERLRTLRFTHAYVSEFARARQTAEILLRYQDCTLGIDSRINERRSGLDGQPVQVFNDQARLDRLHFKPPGGESFVEQMARVRSFLDEVALRHPHGLVLAVSHQDPILAAVALMSPNPEVIADGALANCEWRELSWPG